MLTGTDQPREVPDYQTSINRLCELIIKHDPTDAALDVFFKVHTKCYDVDGRNSSLRMRPIQLAALHGKSTAFQHLIKKRNASLGTERLPNGKGGYDLENNLIEYAGQQELNQDIQKYIWDNKLWRKFGDPTLLEVYALAWCGQITKALDRLRESPLSDAELNILVIYLTVLRKQSTHDLPLIKEIARLKTLHKRPRIDAFSPPDLHDFAAGSDEDDDENFSDPDDISLGDNGLSRLQRNVDAFCRLAGDDSKDHTDLANFVSVLTPENFNVDARHTESRIRAVEAAAKNGSFESFKYLIEELHANIAYDIEEPIANLMNLISPIDDDDKRDDEIEQRIRDYYIEHRLWEKQNDGTTELHAHAWAGNFEKVQEIVFVNAYKIFALNVGGESVLDWAHATSNKKILPFLNDVLDEMIAESMAKHFSDNLRDIFLFKAKFFHAIDATQDGIDAYCQALHFHRHATIDFSRATEDKILRDLSKQFCEHSMGLLRPIVGLKATINVGDKIDKTVFLYANQPYPIDTLAAMYEKATLHMKEAMRCIHVLETKTLVDTSEFIIFRKNTVVHFINFAQIYKDTARHLHLNKLYAETLIALQLAKRALESGLSIADHAQNNDYLFYYGPGSPPPDPSVVNALRSELHEIESKIKMCANMAESAAFSPTNAGFTIFKRPETLPITRPPTHSSSSKSLVIRH